MFRATTFRPYRLPFASICFSLPRACPVSVCCPLSSRSRSTLPPSSLFPSSLSAVSDVRSTFRNSCSPENITGGEGLWKPVITLWIHWKHWSNLLSPLPPDTFWKHFKCYLAICPTCVYKITFQMFPGFFLKCSQHAPKNHMLIKVKKIGLMLNTFTMCQCNQDVSKMAQCSQHVPIRHMLEIFWEHFRQHFECYEW